MLYYAAAASKANIYSSNSEDEESEEDERNRKRLLKAKKLDSDKVGHCSQQYGMVGEAGTWNALSSNSLSSPLHFFLIYFP